ncbi:MAG: insulinase family protein [Treponema sp.]|nr:insulinase family protein [Treponema sp.]
MKHKKPVYFIVSLVLLSALIACASNSSLRSGFGGLGKAGDPVPFMEDVRTGTLPNGLRYFILENSRPEGRAYLTLAVDAGSILEEDDEQGLAHFVEHMAFNGTRRFPESELVNYLRSLGMRFGPEVNAYTSYDETVYGIEVPVETGDDGLKRIPSKALDVMDDWTYTITFAEKDVDDERSVIMEEYRSRLGAMDRIRRKLLPILYEGSPYAVRYPIGLPEVIEGAPASRLEGFYKKWYRPDNMALILVGDFDAAALEAELSSHFTAPQAETKLNRPHYSLPKPKKGALKAHILTDPELPFTRVDLYFKRPPAVPETTLAGYRNDIIDYLIDHMLSLRFDEAASKSETPYVGAGAGNVRYGFDSRYYVLMAEAKADSAGGYLTEASLEALLREKESMIRYGFSAAELQNAKTALLSNLEQMVSEKDRQESSGFVNQLSSYFLNGGYLTGVEWDLNAVNVLLPGIGEKDIAAAVKAYFEPGDIRVFVMAPEQGEASLPPEARIRELVLSSSKMKLEAPAAAVSEGDLLDRTPEAGKIAAESVDEETGAHIWDLANGARVILRETKNKNNEIALYAMARGGTSSAPVDEDVSVSLAAEMAAASGLGPYSRPELVKKLTGKQVSFSFWTSNYYRGFQGSSTTGDIKTLFEMLYLGLTRTKLDPDAVKAMMDQYRTSLVQQKENPQQVFFDEISRVISGGHPHFKPMEAADLEKLDMEKAMNFLRRCFNPADYTLVITGNLDLKALRPLVESYLASIPGAETFNQWTDLNISRPGATEKKIYKGREEQSIVYMGWFTGAEYSEALSQASQAASEYLDIKMTEEIREKLGGVYSISAGLSASPVPRGELMLQVYFACDPRRADELSAAVQTQLETVVRGPLDTDTFDKSIKALKKEWEANIQSNAYIAQSYANSSVLLKLPLSRLQHRPEDIDAVRPEDIQAALSRLLDSGPARITLYPEHFGEQ